MILKYTIMTLLYIIYLNLPNYLNVSSLSMFLCVMKTGLLRIVHMIK